MVPDGVLRMEQNAFTESHQTLEPPRIQLHMSHTFINNFRGSPTPVSEGEIQELERKGKHVIEWSSVAFYSVQTLPSNT